MSATLSILLCLRLANALSWDDFLWNQNHRAHLSIFRRKTPLTSISKSASKRPFWLWSWPKETSIILWKRTKDHKYVLLSDMPNITMIAKWAQNSNCAQICYTLYRWSTFDWLVFQPVISQDWWRGLFRRGCRQVFKKRNSALCGSQIPCTQLNRGQVC